MNHVYAVYKRPTSEKYTQNKSKVMEKDILWKWKLKKKTAGIEILVSDSINFKTKAIIR